MVGAAAAAATATRLWTALRSGATDLPHVTVVGEPALSDALAMALHAESLRTMVGVPGAGEEGVGEGAIRQVHHWLRNTPPCIDGRRRTALALRLAEWSAEDLMVLKTCMEVRDVWWVLSAAGSGSRLPASVRSMSMLVSSAPADPVAFAQRAKPGLPEGTWEFLLRANCGSLSAALGAAAPRAPGGFSVAATAFRTAMYGWNEAVRTGGGRARRGAGPAAGTPAEGHAGASSKPAYSKASASLREAACKALATGGTSAAISASVLRAAEQLCRSLPEPRRSEAMRGAATAAAALDVALVNCRRHAAWVLLIEVALLEVAECTAAAPAAAPPLCPAAAPPLCPAAAPPLCPAAASRAPGTTAALNGLASLMLTGRAAGRQGRQDTAAEMPADEPVAADEPVVAETPGETEATKPAPRTAAGKAGKAAAARGPAKGSTDGHKQARLDRWFAPAKAA